MSIRSILDFDILDLFRDPKPPRGGSASGRGGSSDTWSPGLGDIGYPDYLHCDSGQHDSGCHDSGHHP